MPAESPWTGLRPWVGRRAPCPTVSVIAAALAIACSAPRPEAPPVAGVGRVSGKIVQIHRSSNRLELANVGRHFSVFYSAETLIKSGAVELSIADIRQGDWVVVSLGDDETAHARLITLAGPIRMPTPARPDAPDQQESDLP